MTVNQQIITIVIVVLGTMTTRFLPFLLFPEGKAPPPTFCIWEKFSPMPPSVCWWSIASKTL